MIESVIATDRDENSRTRSISLLIAGYDPYDQCGRIYSLSPSGVLLQEDTFAAAGSGSTFVLGYLDHHQHHEKKIVMDEETAIQQCVQAVQLAITRDAASGGLVRVFICNQQGIQERLVYPPAHKNKMEAASMVGAKES
jgi:20S proteasome alpha/beta subunit